MIKLKDIVMIHDLMRQGLSIAAIARETGLSPKTVRRHLDRDAQVRRIDARVRAFQRLGQPVVSIDTGKKEVVGQYRNGGREWRLRGEPEAVNVHDFPDPALGKAILYGVYDITANGGGSNCSRDHLRKLELQKLTDDQMDGLSIRCDPCHGDWNYTLSPRP